MKKRKAPPKRKNVPNSNETTATEAKRAGPWRRHNLLYRDRQRLIEGSSDPRTKTLLQEAGRLIAETEFCQEDKWRKVPAPLSLDEIDFQSLESGQLAFAVFWEYARDVVAFYHEVEIPVPVAERHHVIPWIELNHLFPLPIVRLKREGLFNYWASEHDAPHSTAHPQHQPGFTEFDPTSLKRQLEVYTSGSKMIPDDIVGIGPVNFSKALNLASKAPGAHTSYHAVGIDWSQGVSAIKAAFNRWIDTRLEEFIKTSSADIFKKRKRAISREVKLSKLALAQLAAWRAKRSGMNAKQYLDFRVQAFAPDYSRPAVAGTERMKLKAKALSEKFFAPIYLRSEEFNEAAAEAESRLANYASKLARFDPSNITVSVSK